MQGNSIDPAPYINSNLNLYGDKTLSSQTLSENLQQNSAVIKIGDKVKLKNAVQYNGTPFKAYFDKYDVLQISGDRIVIGVNKIVTAAVNIKNLIKT